MSLDVTAELREENPISSYTATKLSPREVARTFVPPPAFATLRDARNAILVGPRGSGKTTLLKMLTPEGLSAWQGDDADTARRLVQDVGVFVGVDAMWAEQVSSGGAHSQSTAFGAAAYALHIARSLSNALTFRFRTDAGADQIQRHLELPLTKRAEADIARRLARLFKLDRQGASFNGVARDIGDRLNELGTYRYRIRDGHQLPDWAYLNPLHAVSEVAEMVNEVCGEPDRKWALLFDELELAPDSIVEDILRRLRGNEPTLIFKLSLAPILKSTDLLTGPRGAIHGQDVDSIPLTTPDRSDDFVAEIFDMQRRSMSGSANLTPQSVLGESIFDAGESGGRKLARVDPYRKGARVWQSMQWLRAHDASFDRYLRSAGIELDALDRLAPAKRASHIRKIRNLAIVRAHFREGSRIDTQSTRQLYTGEATMLAIPDGNPRMATIMVRELMTQVSATRRLPLERRAQATAVRETTTRFMALLHAQTGIRIGSRAVTMVNLLDAIGEALYARVVDADFSADVPAGFFVDEAVPERYLTLLTQAVNTGAIVHIPKANSTSPIAVSARGRHYRLSYLLAPRYGLPIRQGKTVGLWKLLEDTKVRTSGPAPQELLPIDFEEGS